MTLPLSARIYGRLLALYPEKLRRDFGSDMALVFADDLDAARREEGLSGVIRVWRCALGEVFRYALPEQASSAPARIAAVWLAQSIAILAFEFYLMLTRPLDAPTMFHAIFGALLLPANFMPLLAFASFWVCRDNRMVSLDLEQKDRSPC